MIENLTTASPVEVDTTLAGLYGDLMLAGQKVESAIDTLHRVAGDKQVGYGRNRHWGMTELQALAKVREIANTDTTYVGRQATEALARLDAANLAYSNTREEMGTLDAEWVRRGRWTRAFLVITQGSGHVHRSMSCSTTYETTQYAWLPELSGHDEAEIIAKSGSDACTICYPDAPVNDLKRPRSVFSAEEKAAQKSREKRAEEKAARLAKKIEKGLTEDGSEFVVSYSATLSRRVPVEHEGRTGYVNESYEGFRKEYFKTEQAALQWVVQYVCWDGKDSDKAEGFAQVVEAVAAKHGKTVEQVWAEIDLKVIAKNKRDSRY